MMTLYRKGKYIAQVLLLLLPMMMRAARHGDGKAEWAWAGRLIAREGEKGGEMKRVLFD